MKHINHDGREPEVITGPNGLIANYTGCEVILNKGNIRIMTPSIGDLINVHPHQKLGFSSGLIKTLELVEIIKQDNGLGIFIVNDNGCESACKLIKSEAGETDLILYFRQEA